MKEIINYFIHLPIKVYVISFINLLLCYSIMRLVCYSWGKRVLRDILRAKQSIVDDLKDILKKD